MAKRYALVRNIQRTPRSIDTHRPEARTRETASDAAGPAPTSRWPALGEREALIPGHVLGLQRQLGNRAVQRWIERGAAGSGSGFGRVTEGAPGTEGPAGTGEAPALERLDSKAAHAPGSLIQREIVADWPTESDVTDDKGRSKKRSKQLLMIDAAVAQYQASRTLKGTHAFNQNIARIDNILGLITAFRAKKTASIRSAKMGELRDTLVAERAAAEQAKADEQASLAEAGERQTAFGQFSGDMGDHATRDPGFTGNAGGLTRFQGELNPRIKSMIEDRNDDGTLSDEAIAKMTAMDRENEGGVIDFDPATRQLNVAEGVSQDDLAGIMETQVNPVTGETIYPELANAANPAQGADQQVTESIDIAGINMDVTYNPSDANFDDRLALVVQAVQNVRDAGFNVPPLDIRLPKLGRTLTVGADHVVTTGDETHRAIFVAPDFMHVSSANINNPLDTKASQGAKGPYKFSSTALDPSGSGTIVHEIGHFLHFVQNPGKFHELFASAFPGPKRVIATGEVSEYAGKPREFVAEVFLGLVYGTDYSDAVMEMYESFGGPAAG